MSEGVSAHQAGPSAGTLLRHAREQAGLHVSALSGALKVPDRQIEALEQDRFDQLPDIVYARALAASVCRTLKLDAQPVLAGMPAPGDSRLGKNEPINVPFREPGQPARGGWRDLLARPAVVAALVLVVGAVILLLLPLIPNRPSTPSTTQLEPAAAPSGAPGATPGVTAPGMVTESTQPVAPTPGSNQLVAEGTQPVVPNAVPAAPAASAAPAAQAPAAESLVQFRTSRPTWVQVTDARGAVPLRRELAAGESVSVSGALPLAVVVGSASGTQVQVRGQPLDLRQYTRDNVARFEVR